MADPDRPTPPSPDSALHLTSVVSFRSKQVVLSLAVLTPLIGSMDRAGAFLPSPIQAHFIAVKKINK